MNPMVVVDGRADVEVAAGHGGEVLLVVMKLEL